MITSQIAIWVMVGLAVLLAVIIPVLDSLDKLTNFISLRWTCIAIILLIMVGVVIDFDHLADSTRDIVLEGGLIVVGLYLALRTIEKILSKGWLNKVNVKGTVQKGDLKATAEIKHTDSTEESEEKEEDD